MEKAGIFYEKVFHWMLRAKNENLDLISGFDMKSIFIFQKRYIKTTNKTDPQHRYVLLVGCPRQSTFILSQPIFVVYNIIMKYKVATFAEKFRTIVGDSTMDVPDKFIIDALNWAFSELPLNPKLDKAFSKNRRAQIPVGHYRFNLLDKKVFRRLTNLPSFSMWTSTGGDLCPLKVCAVPIEELYAMGIPSLMKPGRPCHYAIEQEDDNLYLVFDRPIDTPIILQYIAYGFPKPITSMDDTVEISAVVENAILEVMRVVWYREADDLAFAGSAYDYLDNKYIPQMIQMLNKTIKGAEGNVILGV